MEAFRIIGAEGNDLFDVFRTQVLHLIGVDSIDAPDTSAGFLIVGKALGILGIFFRRDEEFNTIIGEV